LRLPRRSFKEFQDEFPLMESGMKSVRVSAREVLFAPKHTSSDALEDSRRMKRLKQVWQFRKAVRIPPGEPRLNFLAALIGAMALGILFLTFHATPAGAGLDNSALSGPQLAVSAYGPTTALSPASSAASQDNLSSLSIEELNRRIQREIHGSRLSLRLHIALLEVGRNRIENIPDYTATFLKQERVDGDDLQDLQTIQLKMRHKPFGCYMKWLEGGDIGREVLFAEGQYDDRMQVRLGGKKAILGVLKLDPTGSMAMKESRHPITEMGLLQLTDLVLQYRKRDYEQNPKGVRWEMIPDQKFLDHVCDCWVVEYDNTEVEKVYRKSITYIDRELSLPICIKNFGFPAEGENFADATALDEATFIEYYGYTDVQFKDRLTDGDFDKKNADYKFRR
jgi:hypothetical protein